jgi:hypothetical protein
VGVRAGATPHSYVLTRELKDEDFAADLMALYRGKAHPVYQDPKLFLSQTFPTDGLKDLVSQVFGRLRQVPGSPAVIRLETAFGGGKTHAMAVLYHIARDGHQLKDLAELFMPAARVPLAPVRTVVIVGDKYSGNHCLTHVDGIETHTIWGELAYQVAGPEGWPEWERYDLDREPPSEDLLDRLLSSGPTVILMDELPAYIRTAKSVTVGHTTVAGITIPFIQRLLTLAATRSSVVVVYSLARNAYEAEAEDLVRELNAVSARVETVIRPTNDVEIAHIVSRRLLEHIDRNRAEATADAYFRYYQEGLARDWPLPAEVLSPAYRQAMRDAYPFHPQLLEILDQKIATIPDFNKTRGALRVLAQTVQNVWQGDTDPDLILPADVDVTEAHLQPQLTSRLNRDAFTHALIADVANAIGDAHAQRLDALWVHRVNRPVVAEISRVIYLHSLVQGKASGATLMDVLLGVGRPGLDAEIVQSALEEFTNVAWYMVHDGRLFRFQTEPSVNKIIADEMAVIQNTDVRGELIAKIQQVFQDGIFRFVYHPSEPGELEDKPMLRLVVMSPDEPLVEIGSVASPPVPDRVRQLFENYGNGFRQYRNTLVFLVADRAARDDLYRQAKRQQALTKIMNEASYRAALANQWARLEQDIKSSGQEVVRAIYRTYRHLYYPDGTEAGLGYRMVEPHQDDYPKGKGQHLVERALMERPEGSKLLRASDTPRSPEWLKDRAWDHGKDEITTEALYDAFFRRGALPFLVAPDPLKESIRYAVREKIWVYRDGEQVVFGEDVMPVIRKDVILYTPERARNLQIGPWAPEPRTGESAGSPGSPPGPGVDVVADPAPAGPRVLTPHALAFSGDGTPAELVQLLRDQGVTGPIAGAVLKAVQLVSVNHLLELSQAPDETPADVELELYVPAEDPQEYLRVEFHGDTKRFQRLRPVVNAFMREASSLGLEPKGVIALTYRWTDAPRPAETVVAWLETHLGEKPGRLALRLEATAKEAP